MSTVFQKYAAALLPFFTLVVGAYQTVLPQAGEEADWNAIAQFAVLVAGAIATYLVPLLAIRWQGAVKTGIAILAAIISSLLPFLLPEGFDPGVSVPVIIVAVLNVIATELGVQIRSTQVSTTGVTADLPSLPARHVARE